MPEQTPGQQVPGQQPHHRFARAAGRATRSFLDSSRDDAERARAERQEHEDRRAAEEHAAAERRAATPATLKVARWWWVIVTLVFALVATAFFLSGLRAPAGTAGGLDLAAPEASATGQFVLAGLAGVLALATGTGAVQLLRSRRSAVGLLTGVAVIVGIPLIVRGHPLLLALALVLLAGAALLWSPPVRRFLR
ncbi:hypothetical protein [Citricoccus sp.]|uniref:hypothetical protein n=1 Tax=Citricoccus sp. TaxID=1978372 RepID=UPI0028BF3FBC|nr:hypothetical protein [Citricoccus sp.]